MNVVTRFAPSPTGLLHVGGVRTALISWLFARHHRGKFVLRIDDTDLERSKKEYEDAIKKDLKWLGMDWDVLVNQIDRLAVYAEYKHKLLQSGRLYPCYETKEELQIKRKIQLSRGQPPIYDRAALRLTEKDKNEISGREPHYRFKLEDKEVQWNDMIHGNISFESRSMSDPIIIREDGSWTYMLCSVVDDVDFGITHIIRGDDHISNTAIHIQMFEALGAAIPAFGHLSRVTTKENKISKRLGGFDVQALREEKNLEPMTINNFLVSSGTVSGVISSDVEIKDLIGKFNINNFSCSPTIYSEEEMVTLNHKILAQYNFEEIRIRLEELVKDQVKEAFWQAIRGNITLLQDSESWYHICYGKIKPIISPEDKDFLLDVIQVLPKEINSGAWQQWIEEIKKISDRKGIKLFMPLRLALTGKDKGPEMHSLLALMDRNRIVERLEGKVA